MIKIVDFHSHILPCVDDGSKSLEMSIEMLKMMAKQGVRHVVATPHFYPQSDTPERFLARRKEAEMALREEMRKYPDLPTLSFGAEVYYFPGLSDSDSVSELRIDGKRCILIAHIDRYIGRFRTYGIPRRLAQLPVLVQANAEFFLERSTASMALRMLKQGKIHLLGSDCHNLTTRKPNLGSAVALIQNQLGARAVAEIHGCQRSILEDHM